MKKIRRVGPMSVAKVVGAIYALFGFIAGLIFSLVAMMGTGGSEIQGMGAVFGVGALIFLPLIYGVMGFIFGAITAWLYNFVAKKFGGIEISIE